jgi:hypothetical protein
VPGTELAAAAAERGDEEAAQDSSLELSFGLPADFARPSDLDAAREETMVAGGGHRGTERGKRTEQEADPSVAAKSLCASGSTTAPSSTSTVADGRRRAAERQTLARYHVEFYVNFLCVASPAHTHTLYICIMHKSPLQMF